MYTLVHIYNDAIEIAIFAQMGVWCMLLENIPMQCYYILNVKIIKSKIELYAHFSISVIRLWLQSLNNKLTYWQE